MTLWIRSQHQRKMVTTSGKPEPQLRFYSLMSPKCRTFAVLMTLLLCMPALPHMLYGQPAGNLERLQECANAVADSVLRLYSTGDTICLEMAGHPAAWMVEGSVLGRAMQRGIGVLPCPAERAGRVTLAVTSIGVAYRLTDDDDLLARDCRLEVHASLPGNGSLGGRSAHSFAIASTDTVPSDQTSSLEASGYDFAKGTLPQRSGGGFWKKIIEPAVVLGASAVIVILLFTVRSQ